MEDNVSKVLESVLVKLGIYQIVGGSLGIIFVLWNNSETRFWTVPIVLILIVILTLFLYSIFCGILCLQKKENALIHSLINQALQIFGVAMFGFAFMYISGCYFTIGLDLTEKFRITFGLGISKILFNIYNEPDRLEVNFNLIAFALVCWIAKLIEKAKIEKELRNFSSIGEN